MRSSITRVRKVHEMPRRLPKIGDILDMIKPPTHVQILVLVRVRQARHNRRHTQEHGHIGDGQRIANQVRSRQQVVVELLRPEGHIKRTCIRIPVRPSVSRLHSISQTYLKQHCGGASVPAGGLREQCTKVEPLADQQRRLGGRIGVANRMGQLGQRQLPGQTVQNG